jgi:hypothetical protein
MDYPKPDATENHRPRRIDDAKKHPELFAQLADLDVASGVERFISSTSFRSIGTARNISRPLYTLEEIKALVAPLKKRIADLEANNSPPKSIN